MRRRAEAEARVRGREIGFACLFGDVAVGKVVCPRRIEDGRRWCFGVRVEARITGSFEWARAPADGGNTAGGVVGPRLDCLWGLGWVGMWGCGEISTRCGAGEIAMPALGVSRKRQWRKATDKMMHLYSYTVLHVLSSNMRRDPSSRTAAVVGLSTPTTLQPHHRHHSQHPCPLHCLLQPPHATGPARLGT